jgi:hypothetical protein
MRQANDIGANVNWSQVMAQAYFVRAVSLFSIIDEKASRRGRIDSEGVGAKLCGKSTADSGRVGA